MDVMRGFDLLWGASEHRNKTAGRMGSYDSTGAKRIKVAGRRGWAHVRIGPDGELGQGLAFNNGAPWQWNCPLVMRRLHGTNYYEIVGVLGGWTGIAWSSAGGDTGNVGPHTHRIGSGLEYVIEALRFEKGRVEPFSGMSVYITPFRYVKDDGTPETWPGGYINLTANKPASAGNWAWVLVGVDRSDNTAVAVTGTEYSYATPLTSELIDDVVFTGYEPCGAIRVRQDDTDLNDVRDYADAHFWFGAGARHPITLDSSTILTIASGAVTATTDYHIIAAESGTADDLDTITAASDRQILVIQADAGDTITVRDGVDNINLNGAANFELSGDKTLLLFNDGTNWSDAGAGGGGTATDEKVKVSSNDTTADYLLNKLAAGVGISITETGDGGDEDVTIASTLAAGGVSKTVQTHTVLHSETLASAANFDVSGISQDYDHLLIRMLVRTSPAVISDNVYMYFNNDTTDTNYSAARNVSGNTSASQQLDLGLIGDAPGASGAAGYFAFYDIRIPEYTGSKTKVAVSADAARYSTSGHHIQHVALHWENTAAINRITVTPTGADTLAAGSYIEIIGVREEAIGGAAASTADVSNPPTDAELDSAFGTPAAVGEGFLGLVDDAGADANVYLAASNGTSWWYTSLTKAA